MDGYIPFVISKGDPFTRGYHLGSSETERVTHTITAYMDIFVQTSELNYEAVLTHTKCLCPRLLIILPTYLRRCAALLKEQDMIFAKS